jgi:hypothetical protein
MRALRPSATSSPYYHSLRARLCTSNTLARLCTHALGIQKRAHTVVKNGVEERMRRSQRTRWSEDRWPRALQRGLARCALERGARDSGHGRLFDRRIADMHPDSALTCARDTERLRAPFSAIPDPYPPLSGLVHALPATANTAPPRCLPGERIAVAVEIFTCSPDRGRCAVDPK